MSKWRGNPWAILITLSLGFFMTLLDLTIVNIAIPSMITALDASLDEILWVVNAYVLVLAVLLITAGRLGDLRGQRTLFVGRSRGLHPGQPGLRAGTQPDPADRVPGRAGHRRGPADAADDGHHHRHVPGRSTRHRPGHLGRRRRPGHRRRPDAGRRPGDLRQLAVDLHRQRADRGDRAGDDVRLHPGHPDGAPAQARPARRGPRHRRPVLPDLRPDRGPALLVERRDHRPVRGRSRPDRALPAAAAQPPGRGAARAVLAVPQPQLHGDQRRRGTGLRRDPRLLPADHHLPAVRAGLLRDQGGADPGADVA